MLRHCVLLASLLASTLACTSANLDQRPRDAPPLVQPGAPGEPSRPIDPLQAATISGIAVTDADVHFMQGMIGHHAQAIDMTRLLESRTMREDLRLLGRRIEVSQIDEIRLMEGWLRARGQAVPDTGHVHELMPGMLTPAEMDRMAQASGPAFDRLFLEGMIKHHDGAIIMVETLFDSPGAAQDPEIFAFASDVDTDQRIEIMRMAALLHELSK